MSVKNSVIVVGGGIMGVQTAWHLAQMGQSVTVLDQFDVPNQWAASGDHLRVFRLTYGKDAFYTEMALKSLPLWLELNTLSEELCLQQNGVLELAAKENGYEAHSLAVLKDQRIKCERLDRDAVKKLYADFLKVFVDTDNDNIVDVSQYESFTHQVESVLHDERLSPIDRVKVSLFKGSVSSIKKSPLELE